MRVCVCVTLGPNFFGYEQSRLCHHVVSAETPHCVSRIECMVVNPFSKGRGWGLADVAINKQATNDLLYHCLFFV